MRFCLLVSRGTICQMNTLDYSCVFSKREALARNMVDIILSTMVDNTATLKSSSFF